MMNIDTKHKIYIASSWRNLSQPRIVALLRSEGHDVYDFMNPTIDDRGFHWSQIDEEWQTWTPAAYRESLTHPIVQWGFRYDMDALEEADIVVLLLPSGRSAHVEAAYHRGQDGIVIVHMPEHCEPELMYKLFNALTVTDNELITTLRQSALTLEKARI